MVWKDFCAGDETPPSPRGACSFYKPQPIFNISTSQWRWGFPTVWAGMDPGEHRFCPRFVGVVDVWKNFQTGAGSCPPPVTLVSYERPSLPSIGRRDWGFHTVRGDIDLGGAPFSSPGCQSCRCMKGFPNRGWDLILPR